MSRAHPRRSLPRRVRDGARAALERLAVAAFTRPLWTLLLVAVISMGASFGARNLDITADLSNLLPHSFPSVQDLDELKERFGGVGYVVVAAWDAPPETLRRFADDLAPRLEGLAEIRYVEYKRPLEFLETHALYYMETDDLEDMYQRLRKRWKWEKRQANPMYISLEEEQEPPDVDFADLETKYASSDQADWLSQQTSEYYLDEGRRMVALLARPRGVSSDLSYAREVVGEVQAVVDSIDPSDYDPNLKLGLTGRYKKMLDRENRIRADLGVASVVAGVLMLLFLGIHFRGLVPVVLLVVPLSTGLLWTFAAAGGMFGALNILTGFLGAILLGLGIDHGIHLLERFGNERGAGQPTREAVRISFGSTGVGVVAAGTTTVVAFASLAISEFRAFAEWGAMAAVGMLLLMVAFSVILPALLGLAHALGWQPSARIARLGVRSTFAAMVPRWAPVFFWAGLVTFFLLIPRVDDARFNYDFSALEGSHLPSFRLDEQVNRLLGYSQTPVIVLTDRREEEEEVARLLRERKAERGEASTIDFVATVGDLVPADQQEKQPVLERMHKLVAKFPTKKLTPAEKADLEQLQRMSAAAPFDRDDLPEAVRRQFEGANGGPGGGFVMVFPAVSLSDGEAVAQFAREVRGLDLPNGDHVSAAGEPMILADILSMVKREAPEVFAIAGTAVLLTCWLLMGSLRRALLCLLPAGMTLVGLLGYLSLADIELNYMNILVLPVLLGIGVDGAVHLVTRHIRDSRRLVKVLGETGRAIAGSVLTTALGFGALLIADHPGLNSLGQVAVIGLAINLVVILVVFPALLALVTREARLPGVEALSRLGRARERAAELVATMGRAGLSPAAPGTLGAVAAFPLFAGLSLAPLPVAIGVVAAITGLGLWGAELYARRNGKNDPQEVVVDEFAGCAIAMLFVPFHLLWSLLAFGLFRLFDIWKPGPIRWVHHRLRGGVSIMLDDVLAGLMAGLVATGLYWLTGTIQ